MALHIIICTKIRLTLNLSSTLTSPRIESIEEVNLWGPFALVGFLAVIF